MHVAIRDTKKDGATRGLLGRSTKSAWGDVNKHGRGSRRSEHSAKWKWYLRGYINKRDRPFNEDESYKMVEV